MQVVLLKTIDTLGEFGETVEVKKGYARNFLIPQQLAVRATTEAKAKIEKHRQLLVLEEKGRLDVAKARAESAVKKLTFVRKVIDAQERLFGSVTETDVMQRAAEVGTELLRSEITMPSEAIKTTGNFAAAVSFHPDVSFDIELIVVADT